jgi:DNA-directed RNA polymerase specialized sigma24 family protein
MLDYKEDLMEHSNDDPYRKGDVVYDLQLLEPEDGYKLDAQSFLLWSLALRLILYLLPVENTIDFLTDFLELQNPSSSSGRLMYAFLRRTLRAFHLEKNYREAYILHEALLRGLNQIKKGQLIYNSSGWLRSTAYNIIRELKRDQQKTVSLEDHHPTEVEHPAVSSKDLEDDLETISLAFQLLTPMDQRLLNLKIVEGRAWSEIRVILREEGYGDYKEFNLRKRKERALIRLRKKYHALKPHQL